MPLILPARWHSRNTPNTFHCTMRTIHHTVVIASPWWAKQDGTMGILFVRWRVHVPRSFFAFTSQTLWIPFECFAGDSVWGERCNYQSQYCLNLRLNHSWEMNKVNCTPYHQIPLLSSASRIKQQGRGPTGIQITAGGKKREEPADNFLCFLSTKNEYKSCSRYMTEHW